VPSISASARDAPSVSYRVQHQRGRQLGLHPDKTGHRPLAHLAPPREQEAPAQAVPVGDPCHRRAGPHHLLDQRQLLLRRPTATPLHHADHLATRTVRQCPYPYA
jgi:hypothetical protein